jgi:hypothetical protein
MSRLAITDSLLTLKEEFTSVWTLLNDTSRYIKRANLFVEYEIMLRRWRATLQKRYKTTDTYKEIKADIIALRKQLRKEGHDLRLGAMDIELKGFKSDNAIRYGYKRAVLYLEIPSVHYITGEENHNDLIRHLENRISKSQFLDYSKIHSVWFRWRKLVLELAGSDSESKEQYEILAKMVEENRMFLLKKLKSMN